MYVLAAQSGSRSLVVRLSVCLSLGRSYTFIKKWNLECQMVTKKYLPSLLCDISDSSDSSNSIDISEKVRVMTRVAVVTKKLFSQKKCYSQKKPLFTFFVQ